jgi:hypothetical protein
VRTAPEGRDSRSRPEQKESERCAAERSEAIEMKDLARVSARLSRLRGIAYNRSLGVVTKKTQTLREARAE